MSNSEINGEYTTTANGINVRPKLKCLSHFYLEDIGKINDQTHQLSFGAKSESEFRVTHSIEINSDCKIYSICKGQIMIQPNVDDESKINLILKPFVQPISTLSIEYIIYRGLNKSDIVMNWGKNVIHIFTKTLKPGL